jgi:beta-ribofuranosylaminobenzene 5'-phosphate synthase
MIVRVRTPSRLHFGLLRIPGKETDTIQHPAFGGAGLMIEKPGIELTVRKSDHWTAVGPGADRALVFARRVSSLFGWNEDRAVEIKVIHCAPEHHGLGTGTQLGLAVALALSVLEGHDELGTAELARLSGRGERSAIGLYGFREGGFLVEAGKRAHESISPLVARVSFPPEWRIVLAIPTTREGLHGSDERAAFEQLKLVCWDEGRTDRLSRLVLLGLIPGLLSRDYPAFAEALNEFNQRAGEPFAEFQGGIYGGRQNNEIVEHMRQAGALGTGQSSWGPAVFGIVPDAAQADHVARLLRDRFCLTENEVLVTQGCNRGATLMRGEG